MKRPTLRDIAVLAHVSHVTVSLALREHPSIPKETRARIQKIAQEVGYRPDPALSALMSYRRGAKPPKFQATLAWINCYRNDEENTPAGTKYPYFIGAKERAQQLGYSLEVFRLADLDMRFDRLSNVLYARNIRGVLFAPLPRSVAHISALNFKWERFSSIAFGFSLARPKLHVICHAQYRSARLAARKLRSLGYHRIGFAFHDNFVERTDGNFLAGYLFEQTHWPLKNRIPPLILKQERTPGRNNQLCREWFDQYKPDAIFSPECWRFRQLLSPEELRHCGLAHPDLGEEPEWAGIVQNNRMIGAQAVDEVVAMMHTDQRGVPASPKNILISGYWQDGPSAPRVTFQ